MNDAIAKKLGEVWAFSRIGLECQDRAGKAFGQALGDDTDFKERLAGFAGAVEKLGNDTAKDKADKTEGKLRGMMEAYIGDEWDDPVEILEWLSFFFGAAAAHWSLIKGAAEAMEGKLLQTTAEEAYVSYMNYLDIVNERLKEQGRNKAAA